MKDWIDDLERLEKPKVNLAEHKSYLKSLLKQEMYGSRKKKKGVTLVSTIFNKRFLAPVASIILLLSFSSFFFFTRTHTVAYATLEVNPAIQFEVNNNNEIAGVELLNEDAKTLVGDLELVGTEIGEALRLVIDKSIELEFVKSSTEFVLSFRPKKENMKPDLLNEMAKKAEQAINESIVGKELENRVRAVVISNELFEAALRAGMLPSSYIDLIEANVSQETIYELFDLSNMEGINKVKFIEELDTSAAALVDMVEAGFDEQQAIAMLKGALLADKELEELSTIIAAMIDIKDAGGNPEPIFSLIQAALERKDIDQEKLLEEITTLTAAYIDMIEEGISEEVAVNLIKEAMNFDPSLEEITTITSILIDAVEDGISETEAMSKILSALKNAGGSVSEIDDLLEDEFYRDEEELDEDEIDLEEEPDEDDVDKDLDEESDEDDVEDEDSDEDVDEDSDEDVEEGSDEDVEEDVDED
jgi:hypothetical protein